VDFSEE
jgi:hypothetical protein